MVEEARRILYMMANVPKEAMPPESIWHSPQKCAAWVDDHMPGGKDSKGGGMLEFKETEIEKSS